MADGMASAEGLLCELRGASFRRLCSALHAEPQGLSIAARTARRAKLIDNKLAKQLVKVDEAYAIVRHLSQVRTLRCLRELDEQLAKQTDTKEEAEEIAPFDSLGELLAMASQSPAPVGSAAVVEQETKPEAPWHLELPPVDEQKDKTTEGSADVPSAADEASPGSSQPHLGSSSAMLVADHDKAVEQLRAQHNGKLRRPLLGQEQPRGLHTSAC